MASHLHIPVGELRQRITSTEFLTWMEYLEQEVNDFHREDYYLAQIAAEIRRQYAKDPGSITTQKMLIKFESKAPDERQATTPKDKTQNSKNFWLAIVGVGAQGE